VAERSLIARVETQLGLGDADFPRGLLWVYVAGAILAVPVFSRNIFELTPRAQLDSVLANALPFIVIPGMVHSTYAFVLRRLLVRVASPSARACLHLFVSSAVAALAGVVLFSAIHPLGWSRAPLSGFVASAIVLTWAFVIPAKIILAWQRRAEKSERERTRAEAIAIENELSAIQSRTHPHFLFNALNTVASLIPENPTRAEATLERFADVLRYLLETACERSMPLARDLEILAEYLEIQRERFGEDLRYSIDIGSGLADARLPPLVLLPLVENAVLHGRSPARANHVRICVRARPGLIELRVEDQGPGTGGSLRRGSGTALRDLKRRLAILYDGRASVVDEDAASGHAVVLILPVSFASEGA